MVGTKTIRYQEAVGRQKRAVARVRITKASKSSFIINEGKLEEYFPTLELQNVVQEAFAVSEENLLFALQVKVRGGGYSSQAGAIRLGIARALIKYDEELRGSLKERGFLRRDARKKERKKFGLRKARRAPQWSKR